MQVQIASYRAHYTWSATLRADRATLLACCGFRIVEEPRHRRYHQALLIHVPDESRIQNACDLAGLALTELTAGTCA